MPGKRQEPFSLACLCIGAIHYFSPLRIPVRGVNGSVNVVVFVCLLSLLSSLFCRLMNGMKLALMIDKCSKILTKNLLKGLGVMLGSHGKNSLSICPM